MKLFSIKGKTMQESFVNIKPGNKFLADNKVYNRLKHAVFSGFAVDGDTVKYETYNAVDVVSGDLAYFKNDSKVVAL